MRIEKTPSENFNDRYDGSSVQYLILHYTGTPTGQDADQVFMDENSGLSPHYMIYEDGRIVQYVEEDKRAWHAGIGEWKGIGDMNSYSVGIELANAGHSGDLPDFPAKQIEALIELSKGIMERHNIPSQNVLGHSDIAPWRKIDPGENFPWKKLARHGIGIWPEPVKKDHEFKYGLKESLNAYGYCKACENVVLVREFQRHFEPEVFGENAEGQVTERTHVLINALLRQTGILLG